MKKENDVIFEFMANCITTACFFFIFQYTRYSNSDYLLDLLQKSLKHLTVPVYSVCRYI